MFVILNDPHPLDLAAWKKHLEWLRSESEPVSSRQSAIELAEMMIEALEAPPAQRPTEAV